MANNHQIESRMITDVVPNNEPDTRALLLKQEALLDTIVDQNKTIKRRLLWMVIGSYARLLLIVVPLVLAIIFLPPLLRDVMKQYETLLEGASIGNERNFDIQKLIKEFQVYE